MFPKKGEGRLHLENPGLNPILMMMAMYYITVLLYYSGPQGSWIVCCLHLKKEFRSCARGHQWCDMHQWSGIFPFDEQLQ